MFMLALLLPADSQAQMESKLQQLLNVAVHDTTFLKKTPQIQYPVVFTHRQEKFYQASPDAQLELLAAGVSGQGYSVIEINTFKWMEDKQRAKLTMRWDDKIVKISVRDLKEASTLAPIRGMKVREKGDFWPSSIYFNGESDTRF